MLKEKVLRFGGLMLCLVLVFGVLTPVARAEYLVEEEVTRETTADGTEYLIPVKMYTEDSQPEHAMVNVVEDNAFLAETHSSGVMTREDVCAAWTTDEAGEIVHKLREGAIYTQHLYLRCSGPDGVAAKNVRVEVKTDYNNRFSCPIVRGSFDVYWEDEIGQKYRMTCPNRLNTTGELAAEWVGDVQTAAGEEAEISEGDGLSVLLKELPEGLDNAVQITFSFKARAREDNGSTPAPTIKPTDVNIAVPEKPQGDASPATPPVEEETLEVVSPEELGSLKAAGWQTFTEENLPTQKTMNSITNNPEWGDEREFLQITELGTGETSRLGMVMRDGQTYEIEIYLRNDYSCEEKIRTNYISATLRAPLPLSLKAGEVSNFTATFTSDSAAPSLISANLCLIGREDLTLKYVDGSASMSCADWTESRTLEYLPLLTGSYDVKQVYMGRECARRITYTVVAVSKENGSYIEDDAEWAKLISADVFNDGAISSTGEKGGSMDFGTGALLLLTGMLFGALIGFVFGRRKDR